MGSIFALQEHVVHILNVESMMSCLSITSPQTELAVAHEKFVKESMKPGGGEWLDEYIYCLILRAKISKREVFEKN